MSARRGRRRGLQLRDLVILSLPIVIWATYAVVAAVLDYRNVRQFDDWWSHGARFNRLLNSRLASATAVPTMTSLRDRLDPGVEDPYAIRLLAEVSEWDRLTDVGDRGWVDARLVRDGGDQTVEVRRRGDTSVHWTTPKVSFTVRAPRGSEIRGFRQLALTGKTVLESHIAHSIAAEFGLPMPFSELTPVYVNEQYYGLFRAVEPIDESYLRRTRRMPGNIFRADRAERGEYFKNVPRNVFRNPYIWDRVAELNDPMDEPLARLTEFTRLVNETSLDAHLRLAGLIDRDEVARMLGAMVAVGDPYHMSGVHNQYWFDDPATGILHPIPWDLRLRPIDAPPTNPLNPFLQAILRDPFVTEAALTTTFRLLEGGLRSSVTDRIAEAAERFETHLRFEELRSGLVSAPGTPSAVRERVETNLDSLEARVEDARLGFAANRSEEDPDVLVLDIEVRGWAGVDLTGLEVSSATGDISVFADQDLDGRPGPGDRLLGGTAVLDGDVARLRPSDPLPLLAAWGAPDQVIVPQPVHYRLFVRGANVTNVRLEVVNRVTGGSVDIVAIDPGTPLGGASGFHPWRFPLEPAGVTRLDGAVTLTEDLRIPDRGRLEVAPGTTVRLAPDVSILSRGVVIARGTATAPIRFVPADSLLPWGTLAMQGPGADGSVFEHVEFVGGGGDRLDHVAYKGMVSVYASDDVRLSRVVFRNNVRSDDAFNAVYSRVHIDQCTFANANGDAIDFDYSSGSISNCVIEDSRNDAIDLMTSTPVVRGNRLLRSGDKGISVGEASEPIIADNLIAGAVRGIEIKDRSDPLILHNTIEGTRIGILGQVKNWRYAGGGRGRVIGTRLRDNTIDLQLDPDSRIGVVGSRAGDHPLGETWVADWPYTALGIETGRYEPGALDLEWADEAVSGPDHELRYDDPVPFRESTEGWRTEGRVRLRHRDRALRADIERGFASWARPVDWSLDRPAELTVEFTGRDVLDARLTVEAAGGGGEVPLPLPPPDRIGLATVALPPGNYVRLRFDARANDAVVTIDPETGLGERRGGRLDVLRVRVYTTGGR